MILDTISTPDDLKKIALQYLPELCSRIRQLIVDVCSKTGGHLASSLGVVELTTALHYVFDSPKDRVIWDVGHQAYAHKILTGRRNKFHTLRQMNGLNGFPNINESPYDCYGTGHSSTSISAALGIAYALKKRGSKNRVIAVIGDGSMTGGLAYEALNQAGHGVGNLIIILNDNEMSISPNVGALSKFLSIHLHGRTVSKIKYYLRKLFLLIPIWGKAIYKFLERAEETTVSLLTPGNLFQSFGCDYIGPLDGHNLTELINVFKDLNNSPIQDKPTLIHVITKKGKGYLPAELNPILFHGIGPFHRESGKPLANNAMTFTKAFGNAMLDIAGKNSKVVAITAAMATGTGLDEFSKKYPDRFFDVGIAEEHAVTFAAGLAAEGYRPVVAIYSTFLQRAYDHIIQDVCLQNLPVTFAIDRAGIVGEDGPTHHGTFDLSYLRSIPNMVLLAPRDGHMLNKMLCFAVEHNGPVAIRYPRGAISGKSLSRRDNESVFKGAEIVYHTNNPSCIILAVGHIVSIAVEAAEQLLNEGIEVIVIDPRFIKPFDFELLEQLTRRCPNVITVEENTLQGGFGSLISEWVCQHTNDINLKCCGIPDIFVEHGSQEQLRAKHGLDKDNIVNVVKKFTCHNNILPAVSSNPEQLTSALVS